MANVVLAPALPAVGARPAARPPAPPDLDARVAALLVGLYRIRQRAIAEGKWPEPAPQEGDRD